MRAERDTAIPRLLYYGLLLLAVIAIAGTGVLSIVALRGLDDSVRRVVHTEAVIGAVSDVVGAFGSAESAHREYLLLADPALLASYRNATQEVQNRLRSLGKLVTGNAAQAWRAEKMRAAMVDRLAAAEDVVRLRDELGLAEAIAGERGGRGKPAAERARSLARELQREELRMLKTREAVLQQRLDGTRRAITFAMAFGIIAGSAGLLLLRRSRRASRRERLAEIAAGQARSASAEKSAFLASMSHEIRTPMNAIFGFSQLLAARVRGEQEQQYLRAIDSSGRALLALINDILDLSKIEAGKLDLNPAPTDVRELTDASLAVFAQMAADKRLTLRAEIAGDVPPALLLDPVRLRQILFNLIGNAVKYTDEGSVYVRAATVREERTDSTGNALYTLRVSVADTGVGIEDAQLERIFEPFVQAGEPGLERPAGTGLGLSITRRIAELMGGAVSVVSTPGRGSEFQLLIPAVPLATAAATPADLSVRADLDQLPPSRLLIVDDVALNRELLAAIFAETHHDILLASSGEQAIEMTREHRPDVVLMDIRMPGIDGRAARQAIRADCALDPIKLIAVTASSLLGDELTLRQEFDGYVRKPFTFDELFAELSRVLPGVRERRAAPAHEPTETPLAVTGAAADAVAAELDALLCHRFPLLRDTLAMREIGQFARDVASLGRRAHSVALASYGRRLSSAVDRFDVTTVESMLHQFPRHAGEAGATPSALARATP